jgi:hypothetical protein
LSDGVLAATEASSRRRRDIAVEDSGDCGSWLGHGDHGGAQSCHERIRLGFGADIFSRAADLANRFIDSASTSART